GKVNGVPMLSNLLVSIFSFQLDCDQILADIKKEGTSCNALWSPVCGTDEKTYMNEGVCERKRENSS
uniref:Kazal-like domain-containing protein n=1 Tax=Podarcis muralis TaxID=64176 RepID=A0A670IK56_PODMU